MPGHTAGVTHDNASRYEQFVDPVDGSRWNIDVEFTDSNWSCLWSNGCEGILEHPAADLNQGCCSAGAHLADEEEAMLISALGASLDPARFQQHAVAAERGVLTEGDQLATRVVDDACIFFNRPGFPGGVGCALHLSALDEGELPRDWKPLICWQAPFLVDEDVDGTRTLRPWSRGDFEHEVKPSWCCTEPNLDSTSSPSAFVGDVPVAESLHQDLSAIVGTEISVQLRTRAKRR